MKMKKTDILKTEKIVNSEVIGIEEAIANHLEMDFAVPFPHEWVPELTDICIQAIKAVNEHELDRKISLPIGIYVTDSKTGIERQFAWAWEVVMKFHLDQWLNSEWQ